MSFPVNFVKLLKIAFSIEHLWWMLLNQFMWVCFDCKAFYLSVSYNNTNNMTMLLISENELFFSLKIEREGCFSPLNLEKAEEIKLTSANKM